MNEDTKKALIDSLENIINGIKNTSIIVHEFNVIPHIKEVTKNDDCMRKYEPDKKIKLEVEYEVIKKV